MQHAQFNQAAKSELKETQAQSQLKLELNGCATGATALQALMATSGPPLSTNVH